MKIENFHQPVLLNEVVKYLDPKPGETVLDATIDGGGHALALAEKILPKGKLVGIDKDAEILEDLKSKIKSPAFAKASAGKQKSKIWKNFILINGDFRNLDELLKEKKIAKINKVLFDLGMSSWHLEHSGRGFSFRGDEPLDMRYDAAKSKVPPQKGEARPPEAGGKNQKSKVLTAEDIINKLPEKELVKILKEYGEERFAKRIAREIVESRRKKHITTTYQLVLAISRAVPGWYRRGRRHFATKTFMALRIAVNDELNALRQGLIKAFGILSPQGRLAVISFHSLEDRIVKNFFREKAEEKTGKILFKKPIIPSSKEMKINPRSRSAKLRIIEKI